MTHLQKSQRGSHRTKNRWRRKGLNSVLDSKLKFKIKWVEVQEKEVVLVRDKTLQRWAGVGPRVGR